MRSSRALGLILLVSLAGGCAGGGTATPVSAPDTGSRALSVAPFFSTPPPAGVATESIDLQFTVSGAAQAFEALETGYSGSFSVTGCTRIASVAPSSGIGPAAVFTITSVAAGSCVFTVSDTKHQTAFVSVTVTTTSGSIQ